MITPTGRAVLLFAAGIPIMLFAVIADPDSWDVGVSYGVLVVLAALADAVLALPPRGLAVTVTAPERIFIGEQDAVTAALAAGRHGRALRVDMVLELRGTLAPPAIASLVLPARQAAAIDLPVVPRRRGRAWIDRLWLRWQGPLALVRVTRRVDVARAIDIVPNVRGVDRVALQFLTEDAISGEKVQHKGEGTEFDALREYRPGFDIRFIDWKHSARHRKLLCKEFRTERNHHVVLAFDTGHLMLEPLAGMPRLDHAINAGLRLAWISLRSGDLVGTFAFDAEMRHYLHPLRGTRAFERIQRATADLDYHPLETNFTLGLAELHARLRRRALVIVFTDFVDTITAELLIESMQRVVGRHVVVFVTLRDSYLQHTVDAPPRRFADVARAVIAHDFLHDRGVVFERLARLGVHCLDVPSSGLPVALINRYLQIKRRGLI